MEFPGVLRAFLIIGGGRGSFGMFPLPEFSPPFCRSLVLICTHKLRGPVAILSISRDTCSDSIAKLFRACFYGVSHNYRAICCKMGYRTDVPVSN